MRSTSVLVIVCTMLLASCSDTNGDATTAPPTTTTSTTIPPPQTTTTLPPELAQCSDALADPSARFFIVPTFDLFACFDVEAYRSRASYEGTPVFPAVSETGSASVESEQTLDTAGVVNARIATTIAGVEYVTLQFGDTLLLQDGSAISGEIPIEVLQSQLAINQTVTDAIARFGPVLRDLGAERLNGIEVTHHQATAEDIARSFEEEIARDLGGEPFTLDLPGTQLDLWADGRGIVIKLGFSFDFAAATADGIAASDFLVAGTALDTILPATSGTATYEIYDFGADITVELPGS